MARRLRLYSHPITAPISVKFTEAGQRIDHQETASAKNKTHFIRFIPRNISPVSHVIIPQNTGLDPNAFLTPLKGYSVRFKGKILDKTLRSNIFKFRTGRTRIKDVKSHHYSEGYAVHGPFGVIGVKVYYQYDLQPYLGSSEKYSEQSAAQTAQSMTSDISDADKKKFKYKVQPSYGSNYDFDQVESEQTRQVLLAGDEDL
mmetsp:Transcript_11646/g.17613  ORF Transcript_11646/g.17613 Transcript_11646/m.17613 type:complete len:201 (-) Transcript_11646:68-670(-)